MLGLGDELKQTVLAKYSTLESTLTDIFITNVKKFLCTFSEASDESTESPYDLFTKPVGAL